MYTGQRSGLYVGPRSARLVPVEVRRCVRSRRWIDGDVDLPLYMPFLWDYLNPETRAQATSLSKEYFIEKALHTTRDYEQYAGARETFQHLYDQLVAAGKR